MKPKITERDFKFFMLGVAAAFIFFLIFEWEDALEGFNDGWNAYDETRKIENKE